MDFFGRIWSSSKTIPTNGSRSVDPSFGFMTSLGPIVIIVFEFAAGRLWWLFLDLSEPFFTQSELIELVLTYGMLSIHFLLLSRDSPPWGTWLRTLQWWRKVGKIVRRKKPSKKQDSNPWPPEYEACALLLCYNHTSQNNERPGFESQWLVYFPSFL